MAKFKLELARGARAVMLSRPAVHGLVGVRDVDEQIIDEALVKFDAGLRLFHLHAEGMGLVIIATTMTAATVVQSVGARRAIILLLTVAAPGYPFAPAVTLLPYQGSRPAGGAEWVVWIPFAGDHRGRVVARRWSSPAWCDGMSIPIAARSPSRPRQHCYVTLFCSRPHGAPSRCAVLAGDHESRRLQSLISRPRPGIRRAARLFETGPIRADMRAQAGRLPAGLEEATRAALVAGDGPRAERGLVVFFAALIRDLALEADRRLADTRESAPARVTTGLKLLEAIWRYYHGTPGRPVHPCRVAVRLAFDERSARPGSPPRRESHGKSSSGSIR